MHSNEFYLCGFEPRKVFKESDIKKSDPTAQEDAIMDAGYVCVKTMYADMFPERAIRQFPRDVGELCDDVFEDENGE